MRNRKRDMQCLKPKGHNGAHSYTWTVRGDGASSKKGAVGLGVAKEIMQLLTPRQVKCHLARLFKASVNNSSRMETPESAVTKLKGLRVPVGVRDSGRRLFHSQSIYGPVPTVASVRSWFSSQSSKAKHKQIAIEPLGYWVKGLLKNFLFKFAKRFKIKIPVFRRESGRARHRKS